MLATGPQRRPRSPPARPCARAPRPLHRLRLGCQAAGVREGGAAWGPAGCAGRPPLRGGEAFSRLTGLAVVPGLTLSLSRDLRYLQRYLQDLQGSQCFQDSPFLAFTGPTIPTTAPAGLAGVTGQHLQRCLACSALRLLLSLWVNDGWAGPF